ncbi:Aerobic respiration control sensor protein ArcB [Palleronia abyssalis]|uniref:Aerobic respiration control sensor protein ArcB n=2 Tax=Palleronia abyssalis TaxID=1501240 RepID=A0A2R8BT40_9RHOB|nr:response regulator [Palleronia abyssalis]SPJ23339.1 Aerobic respiration control sensor protein ArcB [Palleronia abyssalis]
MDCDIAKNGRESIEMAKSGQHDVVLMDIHMPGMDGVEAMRKNVELRPVAPPRVIAVTANVSMEQRRECRDAGFADFVPKPVRLEALKSALGLAPA